MLALLRSDLSPGGASRPKRTSLFALHMLAFAPKRTCLVAPHANQKDRFSAVCPNGSDI